MKNQMLRRMIAVEKPADTGDARAQSLIARICNGESSLFAELVKPYERRLYVTALALLRNEAEAQDAAQEAILKAFTHLRQFRGESRFGTWLIQITVNEARMRRRRQHAELFEPLGESHDDEAGTYTPREFADWREIPSEALERSEFRAILARALARLGQKYREVFLLRDVEHMSIEETAQLLRISVSSVKTRLLRARLMLRDILTPAFADGWFGRVPFEKGSKPW
ncbi:MAG TPA: sigma-70 family RNA polymerase sigma factor [Terriglobales bacterium]|nr:sigma-70 family RNA polymerase sigma factor [Terriglobales bacterium]